MPETRGSGIRRRGAGDVENTFNRVVDNGRDQFVLVREAALVKLRRVDAMAGWCSAASGCLLWPGDERVY